MIAAGYSMDLYCRHKTAKGFQSTYDEHGHYYAEFPHQFQGESFGECKRQAQAKGWVFNRDGDVTCPKCARPTKGDAKPATEER